MNFAEAIERSVKSLPHPFIGQGKLVDRTEGQAQVLESKRFRNVCGCSGILGICDVLLAGRGTHNHDGNVFESRISLDSLQDLFAVEPGNIEIQEYQIGTGAGQGINEPVSAIEVIHRFLSVTNNEHLSGDLVLLEDVFGQPQVFEVVLDEE